MIANAINAAEGSAVALRSVRIGAIRPLRSVLKGHDFSRAATAPESARALAPEGRLQRHVRVDGHSGAIRVHRDSVSFRKDLSRPPFFSVQIGRQ